MDMERLEQIKEKIKKTIYWRDYYASAGDPAAVFQYNCVLSELEEEMKKMEGK